ncbi:aldehyde dehydrogenase family protein [Solimonas marina]|uniref:Aldehyde dehydrogenase n=1 Tax=Solimonas marina TaxID=2714601 RepID=A0A969W9N9_9GAMM|nr:aldehyde dehydrogenase family protein [Solimonas marina]NKF20910.1 aldehyde dehydrogenase family protein [Solimonas marina]
MSTVINLPSGSAARAVFDRVARHVPACAATSAETRIARIRRLMEVMLAARPRIYEAVKIERGLTPPDVDGELVMLKFEADHIAKNLADWMSDKPAPPSLMTLGKKCYLHYEAKGMVLVLPSWNAPYVIGFLPLLGAIAAGNAVIIKPSELAPQSSKVMADIVAEAFPNGEVVIVEGGVEAAQGLLECPFNHIFYIGNNTVGRIIMRAAAEHFASVTLEMGGKNPSIVDASADVEDAALKTAWGRMCNAGQACIAPDYVLVHESVAQRYTEALQREITAMYDPKGEGFAKNPEYPRVINARHFERIKGLIEDARGKGATLVMGGEYDATDRYIAPTIVTDVSDDMKIMQEEIFGPAIVIKPYRTREEVVDYIRRRDKPLAAYVFAKDRSAWEYFLANTTSGSMVLNHNVVQSGTNPYLPFGGVNHSGIGRLVGFNTFAECSNARTVFEEGPPVVDPRTMFPPLTDKYKKQLTQLLDGKPVPDGMVRVIDRVVRTVGLFKR